MAVITSVELGATGRYINLGSPSVLDDVLPITVVAYACPSGTGGGGLGYLCCKFPSGSSGMRMIVEHNGGSPRVSFGLTSSGASNNPFVASAANSVIYNTWQHYIATCSAVITDSNVLSSTINVYIENTLSTPSSVLDGSGSTTSDAANDFFLMNRGPSGTLGRDFVGDLAYLAIWNRVLDSTARQNVIDNGPQAEPTGLVLCWANQADLSTNALSVSARSTFAAGTIPPNTALGGSDSTAPVLTSPTGTQTGSSTGTGGATTDEANGTFYSVASTSSTAPTATQVEAGQMHTGSAAAASANTAVSSTGAKSVNFTGLSPSTLYYAHSMHKDAAGNRSNVVTSSSFTTTAGAASPVSKILQLLGA